LSKNFDQQITLIVAMDRQRAIGRGGVMPWHLPADLRHFKQSTLGLAVVMGRKTFQSIGRPLPGRQTIVISRSSAIVAPGCSLAESLTAALELAQTTQVMIIGGGEIYRQTMPLASRLLVTEVDTLIDRADTWFPEIDPDRWIESGRSQRQPDPENAFALTFLEYQKR